MSEPAPRTCIVCGKEVPDVVVANDICHSCWQQPSVRRKYPLPGHGRAPFRQDASPDEAPASPYMPPGSYLADPEEGDED